MPNFSDRRSIIAGVTIVCALAGALIAGLVTAQAETKKKVKIRESKFHYGAFNRRDPFKSLIVGDFVEEKKMSPVDLNAVELVGVVRSELDRFALLEDNHGFSYILRVGDRVRNGSVVAIGDRSMVARLTNFGQTTKVTMRMAKQQRTTKRSKK